MTVNNALHTLYREYLTSNLRPDVAARMANALQQVGLADEAAALEVYIEQGSGTHYVIPNGMWQGHRCIVTDSEPEQADPGTLWFDLAELTHMIFISTGARFKPSFWLALHPVYVWQFKTFLSLVVWKKLTRMYDPVPELLLSQERFASMDDMAFVTDLYHEEAAAYAVWFRKDMASGLALREARAFLSAEEFSHILPAHLRIWDDLEPREPDHEFYREAVGVDTLDYDFSTRIIQLHRREFESPKDVPDAVRVFFEVWEKDKDIGCMTALLPAFQGYMKSVRGTMSAYQYVVAITSYAPRPSIDLSFC